jgi:hypothetical protein
MAQARLGVDIGRVIIGGGDQPGADTSFLDGDEARAMATPAVPGALETLPSLVQAFSGRVWLVSKCGPKVQGRTRRWLQQREFSRQTGVPMENLRFCLQRPQKADHARQLRLTHFIDDRLDVLTALRGVVPTLLLFGPQRRPIHSAGWFQVAPTWDAVRRLLLDPSGQPRGVDALREAGSPQITE